VFNTVWTFGCRPFMNSQRAACICAEEEKEELWGWIILTVLSDTLAVSETVARQMCVILSSNSLDTTKQEKENSKSYPLRQAEKKVWRDQRLLFTLTMVSLTKTRLPGSSLLSLQTRWPANPAIPRPNYYDHSKIMGSPTIWETVTFLWPMFQLPVSTSHLIKCTF
jgi:hypothetical protein